MGSNSSFYNQNSTVYTETNPAAPADTPVTSPDTDAASSFFKGTGGVSPATILAGIHEFTPLVHQFLTGVDSDGVFSSAQPAFSDLSGILGLSQGGTGANLSATGGASQVLKQSSAGAAITVGQLAASDLSNGVTGSGAVVLANAPVFTGAIGVSQPLPGAVVFVNASAQLDGDEDRFTWDDTNKIFAVSPNSDSPIKIGRLSDATTYGAVSLNGDLTNNGISGIVGGASGDGGVYIQSAVQIGLYVNGTTWLTLTNTGQAKFASRTGFDPDVNVNGQLVLNGDSSGGLVLRDGNGDVYVGVWGGDGSIYMGAGGTAATGIPTFFAIDGNGQAAFYKNRDPANGYYYMFDGAWGLLSDTAGGFWRGVHWAGGTITHSVDGTSFPRTSLYYEFDATTDPTVRTFNIDLGNTTANTRPTLNLRIEGSNKLSIDPTGLVTVAGNYTSPGNITLTGGPNSITLVGSDTGLDFGNGTKIYRMSSDGRMQFFSQNDEFEFIGGAGSLYELGTGGATVYNYFELNGPGVGDGVYIADVYGAGGTPNYGSLRLRVANATPGAEESQWRFSIIGAGTSRQVARFDSSGFTIGSSGNEFGDVFEIHQLNGFAVDWAAWSNDANSCDLWFLKSRGVTQGAHAAVVVDDKLGTIRSQGSDGTGFVDATEIRFEVDDTVAAGVVPSRIVFKTFGGSLNEAMRINSGQQIGFNMAPNSMGDPIGIGYTVSVRSQEGTALWVRASDDTFGNYLIASKTRGDGSTTFNAVVSGDDLLVLGAYGSNGTGYSEAASIVFGVDGTPGAGVPGSIKFATADASGTLSTRLTIDNDGQVTFSPRTSDGHGLTQWVFPDTTVVSINIDPGDNCTISTNNTGTDLVLQCNGGGWTKIETPAGEALQCQAGAAYVGIYPGGGVVASSTLHVGGPIATQPNTIVTGVTTYTVADTDSALVFNCAATCTITLPSASSCPGRWITLKTIAAFTVVSASSNVCPATSNTPGTAILTAVAGRYAVLQSNGTNWIKMYGGTGA